MLQFSLEALTCGLARKRANERAKRGVCAVAVSPVVLHSGASAPAPASSRSWSSSFGHDTPAQTERSMPLLFTVMGALGDT
jgi:hypothetical protein